MEIFFKTLKNYGYPDIELLCKAASLMSTLSDRLDDYLMNYLKKAQSDFDKSMIAWFLPPYWLKKYHFPAENLSLIYQKVSETETNFEYGTRVALLYVLIFYLQNIKEEQIDVSLLNKIKNFLKNEYQYQKKTNTTFEKIKLSSLMKQYL